MIFSTLIPALSLLDTIRLNYATSQMWFIWLHSAACDRAAINAIGSGRWSVSRPLDWARSQRNRNTLDRRLIAASIHETDYDAGIFGSSFAVGFNPLGNLFITFVIGGIFSAVSVVLKQQNARDGFTEPEGGRGRVWMKEWKRELVREIKEVRQREKDYNEETI